MTVVADQVLALVRSCIPGEPALTPDTELLESGLLDSLGIVAVIVAIEDEFAIEFPPDLLRPDSFRDARVLHGVLADRLAPDDGPAPMPRGQEGT